MSVYVADMLFRNANFCAHQSSVALSLNNVVNYLGSLHPAKSQIKNLKPHVNESILFSSGAEMS